MTALGQTAPLDRADEIDLTAFHADGFQCLRGVLDLETMTAVRALLSESQNAMLAEVRDYLSLAPDADIQPEIDRLIAERKLDTLPKRVRDGLSGHFPLEVRLDKRIQAVARDPGMRRVLRGVFGDRDLFMHMPPMARFVLPQNRHAGVPAHQDAAYNGFMSDFITVWTPLVDIDAACGGVTFFRGGGRPVPLQVESDGAFWLTAVDTDGCEPVTYEMGMGDILVFNKWLIHASAGNQSDRTRLSLDMRFFAAPDTSTKHHLDLQTGAVIEPLAAEA